ncbi:transglycosylase family protein [Streptomyces gobiensis]|uniref:transglycosylase family protein n=1 Tax=Streptomyces gobiensis TaxID=2875706 RepID=UPI003BAF5820
MSRGRHRRQRKPLISRHVSRVSLALTAGGAGIALPLATAGSASAAPVSVWDKVAECQSDGNWSSNTGNGSYGGLEFLQSSWEMVGGTEYAPRADQATKDQQIAAAEKLLAAQGPDAWPVCGPGAGLAQNSGAPDISPDAEAEPGQESGDADRYTVASGDTLYGIATAHDIEGGWSTVYEANRETVGDDPDLIFPGQQLTLAEGQAKSEERGSRTAERAAPKAYPNNLDGWIHEALDIMKAKGIPGTYQGIHRNIIRESSGNPNAINNWDINARNGVPSIGLLQVIKPTFDAYHVEGTKHSQWDPVANIVAACNYAADRYGSIDNVNGPY